MAAKLGLIASNPGRRNPIAGILREIVYRPDEKGDPSTVGDYPVAELRRALRNITQPVLTAKLQELEADGLVKRTIHEETPPRVEYEMTADARRFRPFVRAIVEWAGR